MTPGAQDRAITPRPTHDTHPCQLDAKMKTTSTEPKRQKYKTRHGVENRRTQHISVKSKDPPTEQNLEHRLGDKLSTQQSIPKLP